MEILNCRLFIKWTKGYIFERVMLQGFVLFYMNWFYKGGLSGSQEGKSKKKVLTF